MASKKTFLMYKDWIPMMKSMPREKLGELMYAVACYQSGEDVEIEDMMVRSMFELFKLKFDENDEAYQKQCEKNASIAKERSVTKRHDSSRTVTDKDMDKDMDKDSDKDKDLDNESLKGQKHRRVYAQDPVLDQAIKDFIEHRKTLKKPMSKKAIDLFIARLNKMTLDPGEQVELINYAILKGWQTVYEPKEDARSGTTQDKFAVADAWARGEL